jgi:hypothetical protein
VCAVAGRREDAFDVSHDHPAIRSSQKPADPVAPLEKLLENGHGKLDFVPSQDYLTTLLRQPNTNETR